MIKLKTSEKGRTQTMLGGITALFTLLLMWLPNANAAITCDGRTVVANVVAIDQPVMFNRLGASNINGMIYALQRDVINIGDAITPIWRLRPDKRPRPLVLRVREGDCLTINMENRLQAIVNPNQPPLDVPPLFNTLINDQVAERTISMHVNGLQYVRGPNQDDGAYVGNNLDTTIQRGLSKSYQLYAVKEGAYAVRGMATTVGSDANQGNSANLLIGEVIVEPANSAIYRGQLTEEEMRLASMDLDPLSPTCGTQNLSATGHPIINYEARYPAVDCNAPTDIPPSTGASLGASIWIAEAKDGLPILNMIDTTSNTIVHSEINGFVGYGPSGALEPAPNGPYQGRLGHFPKETYPLESVNKRNPSVPNRLEPFRDFASVWHDEPSTKQAFPGFYEAAAAGGNDVFRYVLEGVKDGFMINYGSGGIGSEILANRLGVGPMHDCLTCAYEEFFLTSFTVGDPATLVDIPANFGLENCRPQDLGTGPCLATGPKATKSLYTEDPANIHHSYVGDFAKIRNVHVGQEQHVFHLHNHQWLYNPDDDNSNYLDAQGIGPGIGYTYEINFGGSGNRNKSAGDAIFHCHFYPHFAQGMWYHWRHHDTFEAGTALQTTVTGGGFHVPFTTDGLGLGDGTPAPGARALPDGEIVAGVPIPAVVPLPGKPMAPMPGAVTIKPNSLLVDIVDPATGTVIGQQPAGSLSDVARPIAKNPGFPFWVAGMEDVIGHRPPSPPLDMVTPDEVTAAKEDPALSDLFANLVSEQADGWDGGLPRAALLGYAAGGVDHHNVVSPIDFTKVIGKAKAVFYPETGTDVEHVAMAYHAERCHASSYPDGTPANCSADDDGFVTNGQKPAIGAPYHEPCIDDTGLRLGAGVAGQFFGGGLTTLADTNGMIPGIPSTFNADTPRIYKAANIQYDAVINKVGYHYPQQRIIALWQDTVPTITKERPGQPLVMRINSFDCAVFHHSNLVPEVYEADDYQVRTPTDIIGQHIHLPKWDLTTADGAANGWNYEDGTFSPGAIQERIHALNCHLDGTECPAGIIGGGGTHVAGAGSPANVVPAGLLHAEPHPYFSTVAPAELAPLWIGARTTTQRWFADPVVNTDGEDRGLGIIFTHDHYGPSTHQQIGLYATVLTEPAGSTWVHNETGAPLGHDPASGAPRRTFTTNDGRTLTDGGPTAWQAAILPTDDKPPFREFYLEYSDFQHAYEAGIYVGAGQLGEPLPGTGPGLPPVAVNEGNPAFNGNVQDAFRFAINPPARVQVAPVFPDLVLEVAGGAVDPVTGLPLHPGCPERPCPQAIDVQDPGMMVVNYRNEPVGLRIYDPNKIGPDGKPGMQADGDAGDLALAMASRTDRLIPELNVQPDGNTVINGTRFPPPINTNGVDPGDPFTPMLRAFTGDLVRLKMQSGGHEEEHNATIHGLKWLQGGSAHGKAGNSGWRAAHAGGISEQFTLTIPPVPVKGGRGGSDDYAYSMDASHDGWWTGMWGVLRAYNNRRGDLFKLPTTVTPVRIANDKDFNGPCPVDAPLREFDITAVLANTALPDNSDVGVAGAIVDPSPIAATGLPTDHVGNVALNPAGGSLVYNARNFTPTGGATLGPIHDPTAALFFHSSDMVAIDPNDPNCISGNGNNQKVDPNLPGCPVRLADGKPIEPVVVRAAAGDCIEITLRNKLPALQAAVDFTTGQPILDPVTLQPVAFNSSMPDLANYTSLLGVVKRDRFGIQGSTTLQPNLVRTSGHIGLHPQLVTYDVSRHNGMRVGNSGNQTVAPGKVMQRIRWYAGDLTATIAANGREFTLAPTPIEFGGANIQPAEPIKQGAKSMVGALVIEPQGATWDENTDDAIGRQSATVTANGTTFRDFSIVLSKALTQYWADGTPVPHMNGEGFGIPEDSQEGTGMALNYGIDPVWHRLGIMPNAEFGAAGAQADTFGAQPAQYTVFSNLQVGGDPQTPVFTANAGQQVRMRVTNPYGTSRGSTFTIHGHLWQRDPYLCPGTKDGIAGRCATNVVGSQMIGDNKQALYQSAQESINPSTHFDIVLPNAGGVGENGGDYMFRDYAAFGSASGLWGILRVAPATTP